MEITTLEENGIMAVMVQGSIDALTSGRVTDTFNQLLADGHNQLIFDLSQVDYISSAGLRVMLGTVKEARAKGGDLRLAGVQSAVNKVLQMSGFSNIIKIYSDRAAAISSF